MLSTAAILTATPLFGREFCRSPRGIVRVEKVEILSAVDRTVSVEFSHAIVAMMKPDVFMIEIEWEDGPDRRIDFFVNEHLTVDPVDPHKAILHFDFDPVKLESGGYWEARYTGRLVFAGGHMLAPGQHGWFP